ncbi:hypothetical protein EMCRGX_G000599 [Ephydatia muelleri]
MRLWRTGASELLYDRDEDDYFDAESLNLQDNEFALSKDLMVSLWSQYRTFSVELDDLCNWVYDARKQKSTLPVSFQKFHYKEYPLDAYTDEISHSHEHDTGSEKLLQERMLETSSNGQKKGRVYKLNVPSGQYTAEGIVQATHLPPTDHPYRFCFFVDRSGTMHLLAETQFIIVNDRSVRIVDTEEDAGEEEHEFIDINMLIYQP